ncbi:MAG: serine/threonine protein kinase [Leptolyngbya sp. SIO1D8]|nr:serine/threonine protein kinase [Leptolyngbya sp. SIO1D8]
MAWAAGKQLQNGRYTLESVLGQGRFGITYFARDRNNTPVVIKIPNKDALMPEEFDRLQVVFVQEAHKLARCRHPHIVKTGEPFKEDGIWCIPMEYIDGTTLDKRAEKQLPEAEALTYVRQIGAALTEVHRNGFLHRDVRPANIMVRRGKSEAVLIDFGLARAFDHDLTITRTREIATGFAPIELYSRHGDRGAYTDVYALAATLYELLTGVVPTNAADRKAFNAKLSPPKDYNPRISDSVNKAILRGLTLEGENRPQMVDEWLVALGLPTTQETTQTLPSTPNPAGQTWNWATIWTAVGSLAAIIALLVAIPQCQPTQKTPQAPANTSPSGTP